VELFHQDQAGIAGQLEVYHRVLRRLLGGQGVARFGILGATHGKTTPFQGAAQGAAEHLVVVHQQ